MRGLFDKVFNIDNCFHPVAADRRHPARGAQWAVQSGLPAYNIRTHQGFWRFLVIREAKHTGQTLVHLITSGNPGGRHSVDRLSDRLRSKFPGITTLIHSINDKKSQVAIGDSSRVLFGPGFIEERLGELRFQVSAHSFFQTNTLGAEKLYETISRLADFTGPRRCGIFIAELEASGYISLPA